MKPLIGIIFLVSLVACNSDSIGFPCIHDKSEQHGIYKHASDCSDVLNDAIHFETVVCCLGNKTNSANGVKNIQKCLEYAKKTNQSNSRLKRSGGTIVERGEVPFMAQLGYERDGNTSYDCFGSLISENYVITVAHCINTPTLGNPKFVKLGSEEKDSSGFEQHEQLFNITEIVLHPEYKRREIYNDIALLKLDRNITFTEYVQPVCLNNNKSIEGSLTLAGFGRPDFVYSNFGKLMKSRVQLINNELCNKVFPVGRRNKDGIQKTQFCGNSNPEDNCLANSGSPLFSTHHEDESSDILIGVASFGHSCYSNTKASSVFMRVSEYVNWIESIVWP